MGGAALSPGVGIPLTGRAEQKEALTLDAGTLPAKRGASWSPDVGARPTGEMGWFPGS